MMSLPVWLPGPMHLLGVAIPGPMFLWGVSIREVSVQNRSLCLGGCVCKETSQNQKSRRYASQWNAYLLRIKLLVLVVGRTQCTCSEGHSSIEPLSLLLLCGGGGGRVQSNWEILDPALVRVTRPAVRPLVFSPGLYGDAGRWRLHVIRQDIGCSRQTVRRWLLYRRLQVQPARQGETEISFFVLFFLKSQTREINFLCFSVF